MIFNNIQNLLQIVSYQISILKLKIFYFIIHGIIQSLQDHADDVQNNPSSWSRLRFPSKSPEALIQEERKFQEQIFGVEFSQKESSRVFIDSDVNKTEKEVYIPRMSLES